VAPCGRTVKWEPLVPETLRVLAKQLETFGFRSNTFGIELDILISGRGRSPQLEYFGQLNQCPTRGTPVKTLRVLTKGRKILTMGTSLPQGKGATIPVKYQRYLTLLFS